MGQLRPVSPPVLSGMVVLVPLRPRRSAANTRPTTSRKITVPRPNMTHHNSAILAAPVPCGLRAEGVCPGLICTAEQAVISRRVTSHTTQRHKRLILMNKSSLIDYQAPKSWVDGTGRQ